MFSLNDLEPKGGCQAAIHQASPFVELQPLYCQYFKAPKWVCQKKWESTQNISI
jgi:hypothetical protein